MHLVDVLPVVIAGRGTWSSCCARSPAGPVVLAMCQVEGVGVGLHAVELVHLVAVLPVAVAGRWHLVELVRRVIGQAGPVVVAMPPVEGVGVVELVRLVDVLPVVIAGRGTWSSWCPWSQAGPMVLAMFQVEGITRPVAGVPPRPPPCAACQGGLPMRTSWRAVLAGRSRGCMPLPWCCAPGAQAATR